MIFVKKLGYEEKCFHRFISPRPLIVLTDLLPFEILNAMGALPTNYLGFNRRFGLKKSRHQGYKFLMSVETKGEIWMYGS
jgi:hypothetical protein